MKKLLLTCVTFLLIVFAMAQPGRGNRLPIPGRPPLSISADKKEKIELYKVQFITEKLQLTKEESENFWPVYNAHKKEMNAIFSNKANDEIAFEEAMLNAKKKYKNELKSVLKTEERINEALKVEREFLQTIRHEMMRRRGMRH